jgi:type II secretory pathway component PulK
MKTDPDNTARKKESLPVLRLRPRTARLRGSALLAVFWSVMVLTLAISGWFFWLQQRVQEHGEDARAAEAVAMAHSGYAVAMNPTVDRYSSLLRAEPLPGTGYRVSMESEGGRINLVWVLTGNDLVRQNIFKQWLEFVIGVEPIARDRLMDCLLDYVDADNIARLNGQEDSPAYHPANRMIRNLDELKRIPGLEPLTSFPGWKDLLTLESSGPLDLMEIPEELLRLLPGFGETQVLRWLQIRAGQDQVLHTEDDPRYTGADQVRAALGFSPKQWERLAPLVTVNDRTLRILSEGYSGKVVRQLQVVVRKGTGNPQIRSWIE